MAIIQYLRVSTLEQTTKNQELEIKKLYTIDKTFIDEGKTGTNTDRQGFNDCMTYLRENDTLIVYSLSRLARSTKDLLSIIEELEKKKVKLISLKENIDTCSATGKLLLGIIAVVNQFEVENMKERQLAGIERAKQEGKFKKKEIEKPSNWQEVIIFYKNKHINSKEAMEQLGLKKTTFFKLLKEDKQKGEAPLFCYKQKADQ